MGKLNILEFIMKKELVWAYELEDEFGYSPRSVAVRLSRLKKQGLIINMTKGCWELSEERLANASGLARFRIIEYRGF